MGEKDTIKGEGTQTNTVTIQTFIGMGTSHELTNYFEFAYNRVVHRTTKLFPFEAVYGFNPLTLVVLLSLPSSFDFVHKEGVAKSDFIKKMHERVKSQI